MRLDRELARESVQRSRVHILKENGLFSLSSYQDAAVPRLGWELLPTPHIHAESVWLELPRVFLEIVPGSVAKADLNINPPAPAIQSCN